MRAYIINRHLPAEKRTVLRTFMYHTYHTANGDGGGGYRTKEGEPTFEGDDFKGVPAIIKCNYFRNTVLECGLGRGSFLKRSENAVVVAEEKNKKYPHVYKPRSPLFFA